MRLIDYFTSLIRRQEVLARTTTMEVPVPPRPTAELRRFQVERDRRSVIELSRKMVDEDPRADGVIKALARDACRGGFQVKVKRGPGSARAQQIANDLIERLGLEELIADWVKLTLKDGDTFLENSVDDAGDIVKVTRKPTLQMHRHSNDADEFVDPTRAYWWADELWVDQEPPRDATWFAAWQITHVRWDHDSEIRYGRPLFGSARKAWKRVDEGETDIAVRRKTRAGMKYVHSLEGANESDIEAYKEQNKDALGNPLAAIADFFSNKKTTVEAIQGDARLSEIDDVLHHIRTWWIASPVPMSLLGYGQDLNRDVLDEQQKQYDRALDAVAQWIDKEILQSLIELQWLLKGIWPASLTYDIIRPSRHPLTPTDVKAAGEGIKALKETGIVVDELLLRFLAQLLPGLDADEALELLQKHQEEMRAQQQQPPTRPTTDDRQPTTDDEKAGVEKAQEQ